jgi:hypothetical protein
MQTVNGYHGYVAITNTDGVLLVIDYKPVKTVIITKTGVSQPLDGVAADNHGKNTKRLFR